MLFGKGDVMLLLVITVVGGIILAGLSSLALTGVLFRPNESATHVSEAPRRRVPAGYHT
jgi:hypothetical protein